MARKRKTVPASPPAPAPLVVPESPELVRVVFIGAHVFDGERITAGTERNVDSDTAASLIARRCARMA